MDDLMFHGYIEIRAPPATAETTSAQSAASPQEPRSVPSAARQELSPLLPLPQFQRSPDHVRSLGNSARAHYLHLFYGIEDTS